MKELPLDHAKKPRRVRWLRVDAILAGIASAILASFIVSFFLLLLSPEFGIDSQATSVGIRMWAACFLIGFLTAYRRWPRRRKRSQPGETEIEPPFVRVKQKNPLFEYVQNCIGAALVGILTCTVMIGLLNGFILELLREEWKRYLHLLGIVIASILLGLVVAWRLWPRWEKRS